MPEISENLRVAQRLQELFERQIAEAFAMPVYLSAVTNNREREPSAQATLEDMLRYVDMRGVRARDTPMRFIKKYDLDTAPEQRALKLLLPLLTLEQRVTYETYGYFDVVGGHTGRTYRLVNRKVMNIHKVDETGKVLKTWCVVPEGDLPLGDVLLAQKLALELYEIDTLARARVIFDIEREPKENPDDGSRVQEAGSGRPDQT